MEHRIVMESAIGRRLRKDEIVHHRNRKRDDNRLENLELMTKQHHDRMPKPPPHLRVVSCPHCNQEIFMSGRARLAVVTLSKAPPK